MSDGRDITKDVQEAIDEAREAGCTLCLVPTPTDVFVIRVVAVHRACLEKPDPDIDEGKKETWH